VADEPVVEHGVLTASAQVWEAAVRRAEVIGPLADLSTVGLAAVEEAAAELGISRRQVYVLLGRWRAGEGVVTDLLPGQSTGGRGGARLADEIEAIVREVLRSRYLTRQRRSVAAVCREIERQCRMRNLRVPSRGTVLRRIALLDPVTSVAVREGTDAARSRHSAGGVPPPQGPP
jgi:putative transposase